MYFGSHARRSVALAMLMLVLWHRDAQAYLDPGVGSLIVQSVIAGLAALGYAFRSTLLRFVSVFRPGRGKNPSDDTAAK